MTISQCIDGQFMFTDKSDRKFPWLTGAKSYVATTLVQYKIVEFDYY